MADMSQAPVNGNYAAQHGFPESFNNHVHVPMNTAANFQPVQSSTPTTATPTDQQKNEISKDEVGWFFVEQYYTTMSRNPDKLHLFYSKRSQLVFGTEAESVPVSIGNKAIGDKIKQLDFQECKVRVLNVDSQASFDNILVSVIGEISNKSEPSRKFVQTFVLAEQPNGYYVLNDIFRYLADEQEEIEEEAAKPVTEAPEAPEVPAPAPPAEAQVTDEAAASKVDEKLQQETNGEVDQPEAAPQTNGTPAQEEVQAPVPVVEAELLKEDKPITPEPTPVPQQDPKEEAPVEQEPGPGPSLPKTWANIASKPGAKVPVVPAIPVAAPKAAPAAPAASAAQPAAAPAPAVEARPQETTSTDSAGWQTAGADHKKTQSRAGEEQVVHGYIKNVTDKVDANALKQTLSRFGKVKWFDVNRPKNCAFVEFSEPSGYAAAVAANPHQVSGEQIVLEERRPRGNAFGSNGFTPGRGGAGRGRGDRAGSQGRGGFQRDGRGGFAPRGRGGNAPAKGRSQAQAA